MKIPPLILTLIVTLNIMGLHANATGEPSVRPAEARANRVTPLAGTSAAKADSIYLMGGPGRSDGQFQEDFNPSMPDMEGWTTVDVTASTAEIWHIDTFNAPGGGHAMWCGETFASCGAGDAVGGYGNHYEENLDWVGTVTDPAQATNVAVVFDMNIDVEPGYDFLALLRRTDTGWVELASYSTSTWNEALGVWQPLLDETYVFTVPPADHTGSGGNSVQLRLQATSDHASSDADCLWPSSGHSQIDDITVTGDNGLTGTVTDFESGLAGTGWSVGSRTSVGDFAKLWPMLDELDFCASDYTPTVAFIDDGVVEPCTGGTFGTTWLYGPAGFTHNLTGGCAGPDHHLANEIWSPPIAWADDGGAPLGATYPGAVLAFDVYDHLPLQNGLYFTWSLRTSDDDGATWTGWRDRTRAYYGPGVWRRMSEDVSDLVVANPTHVQIALGAHEWGWIWNMTGTDGTPAPYFDNVSLKVYASNGPLITADELHLAQDAFPTLSPLDYDNLGLNHIRFDMAADLVGSASPTITPGDSLVFTIEAKRPGSVLTGSPRLHYAMHANPVFDPYRAHPTSGLVPGLAIPGSDNRWAFDLPDEFFFYPGDVIHYYIWAEDDAGGDVRQTTLPADLSAFDSFALDGLDLDPGYEPLAWPSLFTVHGLPSVYHVSPAGTGFQPPILYYDDFGSAKGETAWLTALDDLGLVEGYHFDIFRTNAPHLHGSNGLASRADVAQLAGYETVLYSSGDRTTYTLSTFHQYVDKCDELSLMDGWLQLGRNLLATGDGVAYDVSLLQGVAGFTFADTWFSTDVINNNVRPLIDDQATPLVVPVGGNSLALDVEMIAYGGCPSVNKFDALEPYGTAEKIAEWSDPAGLPGAYPFLAAGVRNQTAGSDIVLYAADLTYWYVSLASPPGQSGRAGVLGDILAAFGHGAVTAVAQDGLPAVLAARNAPNPFNPVTEIFFDLPREAHVRLRIYDVRGALVRSLIDERLPAGAGRVARWDGADDSGSAASSGVYFYVVEADGSSVRGKMALIR